MRISCAGLTHHDAPVSVRERYAVTESRLKEFVEKAHCIPGVDELVYLSTCNRAEVYFCGSADGAEVWDALFVGAAADASHGENGRSLPRPIVRAGAECVAHLFRVGAGLESMVMGETEILGQVKAAYAAAGSAGATGAVLNKLFQRAFQAAKHVRSRTAITRGAVSVGSVAVELAERIFGDLRRCRVMILGAGDTSERTARSLLSRGAQSMIVSNRSHDRACALAADLGGRAVRFDGWEEHVPVTDILISSTAAPHAIVQAASLVRAGATRRETPLFVIDLAVPRDVAPEVNDLANVYLYDIDSLQSIAAEALALRKRELGAAERILEEHVCQYMLWMGQRGSGTAHAGRLIRGATPRNTAPHSVSQWQ